MSFNPGLIPNSTQSAGFNAERLAKAVAQARHITIPAGYYYLGPTVMTPFRAGGVRIEGAGGFGTDSGFPVTLHHVGNGPALRLCGNGDTFERVRFLGTGSGPLIEVEGRTSPPTGRHRFRDCAFQNAAVAIHCLGGWYDGGKFVADENHADMGLVECCETYNVGVFLRLENQQAVNWRLRDCAVNVLGASDRECCVVDCVRGGKVYVDRLTINHPRVTLARTGKAQDFSPNNCRLVFRDVDRDLCWDHAANHWLTLLDCTADETYAQSWLENLTVTAFIPRHTLPFDMTKLYRGVPAELVPHATGVELLFTGDEPT